MEDNIKMDLKEVGWEGMNWIYVALVADSCEHGNELSGSLSGGEFLD
jgi:hypothetical protein